MDCASQRLINVYYDSFQFGEYYADIVVNNCDIIKSKAAVALAEENEFQLINYLKGTDIEVEILLNFGKKPEFKRRIFINDKKK